MLGKFQLLNWIDYLGTLPIILVILSLASGMIFLMYGKMLFKVIVMIHAAVAAGYFGWMLGMNTNKPWIFAIGFALIFGILAWPMLKVAVAGISGMVGATLILQFLIFIPGAARFGQIIAAVSFVTFAILGWFLLMPAVVIFTAIEGSAMVILSTLTLIDRTGLTSANLRWFVFDKSGPVIFFILLLAAAGVAYQMGFGEKKAPEQKKAVIVNSPQK